MNIEKYLVLNKYLLHLFGKNDVKALLNELKNKREDLDIDGRSYFVKALELLDGLKIKRDSLYNYDENIQSYVRKISFRRDEIRLKYFQYLAVLFTEIVLDKLKNEKSVFLSEINNFLEAYKRNYNVKHVEPFTEDDLRKIAFWMATGSGKTLIMHINYHQFLNYNLFSPDNIILITPNEGLSKQHYEELRKSGIPCRLYSGNLSGGFRSENEVLIIEITKIVEEKKGKGLTLPVDVFEGKNLVFVDEGHKGKKSEEQKWARLRDKLAENGFVFEYSATFGQILSEKDKDTLQEYAKSIIFDYSYKYFYLDGYGKDFSFLNVKSSGISSEEFQETMFIANLLSFYEQLIVYENNKNLAKEYNIEKPLWIFVGATVTGRQEKQEESDIVRIVKLIKKAVENEDWLKEGIDKIISGKSGLVDEKNRDIFEDRFVYLKEKGISCDDLYKKIFGGRGPLRLYELKNCEGEIGLKLGENDYFGVINIGNVSDFKKKLEQENILIEQDVISSSLFENIKKEDSKINILIGSKKFIEGWDTWRVSSMGLLNIGKEQGPQIIQLFGRGVRLKGKNMSLKRSGETQELRILETLNVYGIKADYLNIFLEAIKKEEVEFETIEVPVKFLHEDKWKNLYILSKSEKKFEETEVLRLQIDNTIHYEINLAPKIVHYVSTDNGERRLQSEKVKSTTQRFKFSDETAKLINWQRLMQELIEYKRQKNYWNLVFDAQKIKEILLSDVYKIVSVDDLFRIKHPDDLERIQNVALLVIKKYIDTFYEKYAKRFESARLKLSNLEKLPVPFVSDGKHRYVLQIDKRKDDLIKEIRELVERLDTLCEDDFKKLPMIYFDRSLYVPLLLQDDKIDKISPPGLVESEKEFLSALRKYLETNKDKFSTFDIYLLRNFPFSGVGFQLVWSKFYPDFIMWIKNGAKQHIVFIDPKGLEHSKSLDDEKIAFAGVKRQNPNMLSIKDIERNLNRSDITLDSFILSATPYKELVKGLANYPSKDEYEKHHVLFLEDDNWVEKFFRLLFII